MSDNALSEYLDAHVYPKLDREVVFADLEPKRKGAGIVCRCPNCGKRRAWIYPDKYLLHCNRQDSCGYSISVLAWLAKTDSQPRGDDFVNAARRACELAGVPFPERDKSPEILERIARAARRADALHTTLDATKEALNDTFPDSGVLNCWQYLNGRNFERGFVAGNELGYLASVKDLPIQEPEKRALGFYTEDGYPVKDWDNRLIGTMRDAKGRLKAVWGRALGESEQKYRWTLGTGVRDIGGIGLDVALAQGSEQVGFEGYLDVLKARSFGFLNTFAIGGSGIALTPERLELLFDLGIRRLILVLDNDKAGAKGLIAAIESYNQAKRTPELFVVDPAALAPHKDPDEYLDANGAEAFAGVLALAAHAYRYKARLLVAQGDLTTDLGRSAIIQSALEYDATVSDAAKVHQLSVYFWTEICESSDSTVDELQDVREQMRQRKREGTLRSEAERAIASLRGTIDSGNIIELPMVLDGVQQRIQNISVNDFELRTAADEDAAFHQYMTRISSSELIGVGVPTMKDITNKTMGLRGFIVMAAQPNIGKTTTAMQMLVEVLRSNPDWCALYASLDMPRFQVEAKMFCYLAQMDFNTLRAIYGARGGGEDDFGKFEMAKYESARLKHRMAFIDPQVAPIINSAVILRAGAALQHKTGAKHCLYVCDFLEQLREPDGAVYNERQLEKYQVGEAIKIRDAINGDPFVAISEVRKPPARGAGWATGMEDVMGSARKSYAADCVILINPLSDYEIHSLFDVSSFSDDYHLRDTVTELDESDMKKAEIKQKVEKIRKIADEKAIAHGSFEVAKIRDGGRRGRVLFTHYFTQSRIEEGLY